MSTRTCRIGIAALAAIALAAPSAAAAATRSPRAAVKAAGRAYMDVRDGQRAALLRRGAVAVKPPRGTAPARATLRRSLGRQAVLAVDPLTATPRVLARLDGTLTGPSPGDAADIAMGYVRAHLAALGLTGSDLDAFSLATRTTSPGGITHLRYREAYRGIPAYDNELRVNVTRDGRVLSVLGSPRHALTVPSIAPNVSAAAAVRRVRDSVGGRRAVRVAAAASGARRATTFRDGSAAKLVLFGARDVRLAWHVRYRESSTADYDTVVDAATGAILHRQNMVLNAVSVWENYPGAPHGGTATSVDLVARGWLTATATRLFGRNVRTWSDVNDDNLDNGTGEDVSPSGVPAFSDFTPINPGGECDPQHKCSWNLVDTGSWMTNRRQSAAQAFYFANKFHDHLAAAPIGFTAAEGSFEGTDPLRQQTDDGAATGPDDAHLDNANMDTPPDGSSPTMQMYLFAAPPFRDVNGGDDAAIVYHEYTHGLSNRLITDADGAGAVESGQAKAMGEGWSDYYALSYLADQGFRVDTAAPGQVDMGAYADSVPHQIRTQAIDCPVGTSLAIVAACPGAGSAGAGGYTYGDYGRIAVEGVEEHADGEIWGETLWQLRGVLGSSLAAELVTEAMRLSPPEPSFLDERNAILQAEAGITRGAHRAAIWAVFASRGMGFHASTTGAADAHPIQDFSLPPVPPAANRPPSGALRVNPAAALTDEAVTFDASSFRDPDGSIARYEWDFDGNGTTDRVTAAPVTAFPYATGGTRRPTVAAVDNRGGVGRASAVVTVTQPAPPPALSLIKGRKRRVRFTVTCASRCTITARLTVSRSIRRKLKLAGRTVGALRRTVDAGRHTLTFRLSRKARRALTRHRRVRSFKARVALSVTDAAGRTTRKAKTVRVRR